MNCWQWKNEVGVHVWLGLTSTPTERPYSGTRNTKIIVLNQYNSLSWLCLFDYAKEGEDTV